MTLSHCPMSSLFLIFFSHQEDRNNKLKYELVMSTKVENYYEAPSSCFHLNEQKSHYSYNFILLLNRIFLHTWFICNAIQWHYLYFVEKKTMNVFRKKSIKNSVISHWFWWLENCHCTSSQHNTHPRQARATTFLLWITYTHTKADNMKKGIQIYLPFFTDLSLRHFCCCLHAEQHRRFVVVCDILRILIIYWNFSSLLGIELFFKHQNWVVDMV